MAERSLTGGTGAKFQTTFTPARRARAATSRFSAMETSICSTSTEALDRRLVRQIGGAQGHIGAARHGDRVLAAAVDGDEGAAGRLVRHPDGPDIDAVLFEILDGRPHRTDRCRRRPPWLPGSGRLWLTRAAATA